MTRTQRIKKIIYPMGRREEYDSFSSFTCAILMLTSGWVLLYFSHTITLIGTFTHSNQREGEGDGVTKIKEH